MNKSSLAAIAGIAAISTLIPEVREREYFPRELMPEEKCALQAKKARRREVKKRRKQKYAKAIHLRSAAKHRAGGVAA